MITIKSKEEIKIMRKGGRILAQILAELKETVRPGITTNYLEEEVWKLMKKYSVKPSFFNYKPHGYKEAYPAALCASVNEEIVHAVPSERILREGDIIGLDLGIWFREGSKSLCVDSAITVPVGKVSENNLLLIETAKKSLNLGISEVKDGARLGDIGSVIQKYAESGGFSVIRDLAGHGVGYGVHEEPVVPNFGKSGNGIQIKERMVICIEPMIASGNWETVRCEDGLGYCTLDKSCSSHFEHTIAVTQNGAEILTTL